VASIGPKPRATSCILIQIVNKTEQGVPRQPSQTRSVDDRARVPIFVAISQIEHIGQTGDRLDSISCRPPKAGSTRSPLPARRSKRAGLRKKNEAQTYDAESNIAARLQDSDRAFENIGALFRTDSRI
jgi:hypothetical protein